MEVNFKKALLPLLVVGALSGCGGDVEKLDEDFGPIIDIGDDEELTEDNFVAVASSVYSQLMVQHSGLVIEPSLNLTWLNLLAGDSSSVRDCSLGGTRMNSVVRESADATDIGAGDEVRTDYASCRDSDNLTDGYFLTTVKGVVGDYPSNDYQLRLQQDRNVDKSLDSSAHINGNTQYSTQINLASTSEGDITYSAVNLPSLYELESPDMSSPFFSMVESELVASLGLAPEITYPIAFYSMYASEQIIEDQGDVSTNSMKWRADVDFEEGDYADYYADTQGTFIVKETTDSVTNDITTVAEGSWKIVFSTNETIIVSSSFESGTTITADKEGDGVVEFQDQMSWDEFTAQFFLAAPYLPSI